VRVRFPPRALESTTYRSYFPSTSSPAFDVARFSPALDIPQSLPFGLRGSTSLRASEQSERTASLSWSCSGRGVLAPSVSPLPGAPTGWLGNGSSYVLSCKTGELLRREDMGSIRLGPGSGETLQGIVAEAITSDQITGETAPAVQVQAQGGRADPPPLLLGEFQEQAGIPLSQVPDSVLDQEAVDTPQVVGLLDDGEPQVVQVVEMVSHQVGQEAFKVEGW
jgi:hypothetical protein